MFLDQGLGIEQIGHQRLLEQVVVSVTRRGFLFQLLLGLAIAAGPFPECGVLSFVLSSRGPELCPEPVEGSKGLSKGG